MNYNELMDKLEEIDILEDKILSSGLSAEETESSKKALLTEAKKNIFETSDLSDLPNSTEMCEYLWENLELSGPLEEQAMEFLHWATHFCEMFKISQK